ncbi:Hsp33 family molecular chaperone [Zavarzinia sp.]|uniref:Hsp33 family molecular chaperone n=1 Tax=Zavarzinia sp. TaxID=2027920 RepID=UPI00356AF0E1
MNDNQRGDDRVLPFQIDALDVRGRIVRLGPVVDTILSRHDYPDAVSRLLAEMIVVATLLGNSVKFDGSFTVQTKSDGPLSLMVSDFATPGALRGYAQFEPEAVAALGLTPSLAALVGKGYLAMTIDQGPDTERYQGIVALDGADLAACAETYFRDSEQIPTLVRLAARRAWPGGPWLAGGLMIQHLPHGSAGPRIDAAGHLPDEADDDHWANARAKAASVTADELVGPGLRAEELVWRLFHEDGIRVYSQLELAVGCRCSREHIASVLTRFSPEDRADMAVDGRIVVTCEFCNAGFAFDPATVEP